MKIGQSRTASSAVERLEKSFFMVDTSTPLSTGRDGGFLLITTLTQRESFVS